MVPAGVSGSIGRQRLTARHRRLRQARQRIKLRQDADHRPAAAPAGDERSGDAGHAPFDREAAALEKTGEPLGAAGFEIAELSVVENVHRQRNGLAAAGIDCRRQFGFPGFRRYPDRNRKRQRRQRNVRGRPDSANPLFAVQEFRPHVPHCLNPVKFMLCPLCRMIGLFY